MAHVRSLDGGIGQSFPYVYTLSRGTVNAAVVGELARATFIPTHPLLILQLCYHKKCPTPIPSDLSPKKRVQFWNGTHA